MKHPPHLYDAIAYSIGCRYCHAKPGQRCINKITNEPTRLNHQRRITDALTKIITDEEVPF